MPRDFDQIAAAATYINNSQTADETTSLPPGYISGFYAKLEQDFTVTISPGTIYVAGRAVKMENEYLLAGSDWVAPRLDHPNHYYIYVDKGGSFRVDLVAPVFNRGYNYYEQPDFGWRVIAKIFVKNNDIIYCSWDTSSKDSTVTVAPLGYTGEADYYCTGTNDEIFVNAAILYVKSAYNGGSVKLFDGTFNVVCQTRKYSGHLTDNVNSAIVMESNISLAGSGSACKLSADMPRIGSEHASVISAVGTSAIPLSNIQISNINLNINNNYAYNVSRKGIFVDYVNGVAISSNYITTPFESCIYTSDNCGSVNISNNVIDTDTVTDYLNGISCISPRAIISSNSIKSLRSTSELNGIYLEALYCIVSNNQISDLSSSNGAAYVRGINANSCSYSEITSNHIDSIKNSTTSSGAEGISVARGGSSASVRIVSNYCYNNGDDFGIANTNSNNFYDAGTDTQVYSNSWQTPVSGEPSIGEKKFKRISLCVTTTISMSMSISIGLTTASAPVGTKGYSLELYYAPTAGTSCPVAFGTTSTNPMLYSYNRTGSYVTDHFDCPVDSSGNFKFWTPGTAPTGAFNLYLTAYYC